MLENAKMQATGRLIANYALVHQLSARDFAARARAVEDAHANEQFGGFWDEIRMYTTAAITSSAFALEAFINECFLISGGELRRRLPNFDEAFWGQGDVSWWIRLLRFAGLVERGRAGIVWSQPLPKYDRALRLMGAPKLKKIARTESAHADALIGLRNRLVHFKPLYDPPRDTEQELERKLRECAFPLSRHHGRESDFVLECMTAGCAEWAVRTSASLVGAFAQHTGINRNVADAFQ